MGATRQGAADLGQPRCSMEPIGAGRLARPAGCYFVAGRMSLGAVGQSRRPQSCRHQEGADRDSSGRVPAAKQTNEP